MPTAIIAGTTDGRPARSLVPLVSHPTRLRTARPLHLAKSEALIGIAVAVVDLQPDAIAVGAIGNVESFALPIRDNGVPIFTVFDAPLLAGISREGTALQRRRVAAGRGHRITIHSIAKEIEPGIGALDIPSLVVGAARRELNHGGLVVAVQIDDLAGL